MLYCIINLLNCNLLQAHFLFFAEEGSRDAAGNNSETVSTFSNIELGIHKCSKVHQLMVAIPGESTRQRNIRKFIGSFDTLVLCRFLGTAEDG